jgi:hypothetical protein
MIFYAVTKGEYSDYHIITITTNKEKAEFLAKRFSDKWDEAKVEEYTENEILFKPLWYVLFDHKGNVEYARCESANSYAYVNYVNKPDYSFCNKIRVYVTADDKESAIKIAAEKRAEFLAREEGVV